MYLSSFSWYLTEPRDKAVLTKAIGEHIVPALPPGLPWRIRMKPPDSLQLLIEWPDKESALTWLASRPAALARYAMDQALGGSQGAKGHRRPPGLTSPPPPR